MTVALELGWAALEPFILSLADVEPHEVTEVREIVRARLREHPDVNCRP